MKRVFGFGLALAVAMSLALSVAQAGTEAAMAGANYKEAKGNIYSWCGYPGPCSIPTAATVLLEKQGPSEVIIGQEFSYQIQVSNRSAIDMVAITLEDVLPEGMSISSITPEPTKREGAKLIWDLGTLPAKTAKLITICGSAMQTGCLVSTGRARVCYEMSLPLVTRVIQCNVELQKTLPAVADLCDPIPMCLTVYNTGSAPATNVCITDQLPEGLLTKDGKSEIRINVPTIPVGGHKTFSIDLKAIAAGEFTNTASAQADNGCYSTSSATVKVVAPALQLSMYAPMDGYICTTIPYEITVTNTGNSPAKDVVVVDTYTAGMKLAVNDGKISKDRAAWNLGTIQPGEQKKICFTGTSAVEGQYGHEVSVTARCAEPKNVKHCITLIGVPGVLTSVKDNCDPVMVGGQTTYTITASNTGTRDATNLVYTVELDDGMEFVAGEGATPVTQVNAKKLSFAPLPVLAKGTTASWTVTIKAANVGDKRFTVKAKTDELQSEVSKSESTNFYQPNMGVVSAY